MCLLNVANLVLLFEHIERPRTQVCIATCPVVPWYYKINLVHSLLERAYAIASSDSYRIMREDFQRIKVTLTCNVSRQISWLTVCTIFYTDYMLYTNHPVSWRLQSTESIQIIVDLVNRLILLKHGCLCVPFSWQNYELTVSKYALQWPMPWIHGAAAQGRSSNFIRCQSCALYYRQ